MKKTISFPIAITLIILCAVLVGEIAIMQYLELSEDKTEEVSSKVSSWEIYRNEKYGLEIKHPKEWAPLILADRQANNIYTFVSPNPLIEKIYYHKPTEILASVSLGEEHKFTYRAVEKPTYQYEKVLKVFYQDKKEETIYVANPEMSEPHEISITGVNFSPDGKYVYFKVSGFDMSISFLFDILTNRNILDDYNGRVLWANSYEDILWTSDGKSLIIKGYASYMSGTGTEGIWVSDYQQPEKLNLVFNISGDEYFDEGKRIYRLYIPGDNILFFEVISTTEAMKTYKYDIKDKKLEIW